VAREPWAGSVTLDVLFDRPTISPNNEPLKATRGLRERLCAIDIQATGGPAGERLCSRDGGRLGCSRDE
jgi:hypothetical protein